MAGTIVSPPSRRGHAETVELSHYRGFRWRGDLRIAGLRHGHYIGLTISDSAFARGSEASRRPSGPHFRIRPTTHPPLHDTSNPGTAGWTAIILAGQRPGTDPLAAAFGQKAKALVRIAGRAMLDRVLETVLATPFVARVVVLGQATERLRRGASPAFRDDARIAWIEASSGISESLRGVVGGPAAPWPVLVTTADHPLLTTDMLESFVAAGGDEDVAVAMVERATILASYPETKRTWLRFSDGAWSGANLFTLRAPAAVRALDLWSEVEQNRKRPLKLFWRFGLLFTLRALTRSIGLGTAVAQLGRRFGVKARLIPLDYAEAAIDVDKPSDHALAEAILKASDRG